MVDCLDHSWRARIDFPPENPEYWDKWFKSYTAFMLHYAKLAEKARLQKCSAQAVKWQGMDKQSDRCRKLIAQVREVYSGIVMHNINHGDEQRFDWLSDVDIIGISGYYPVTDGVSRSKDICSVAGTKLSAFQERLTNIFNKPIMFAEIGVRNEEGCTQYPWDFHDRLDKPLDEQEQADFYDTAMEATWDLDWFCGYFWWD